MTLKSFIFYCKSPKETSQTITKVLSISFKWATQDHGPRRGFHNLNQSWSQQQHFTVEDCGERWKEIVPDDINVRKTNTKQEWINLMIWVWLLWEVKEVYAIYIWELSPLQSSFVHVCIIKCAFQTTEERSTLRQVDAEWQRWRESRVPTTLQQLLNYTTLPIIPPTHTHPHHPVHCSHSPCSRVCTQGCWTRNSAPNSWLAERPD